MIPYEICEMDGHELNRLNDLNAKKMPYAKHRTSGWKLYLDGVWYFGFQSFEQASTAARKPGAILSNFDSEETELDPERTWAKNN